MDGSRWISCKPDFATIVGPRADGSSSTRRISRLMLVSRFGGKCCDARQYYFDLGKLARLGVNLDRACVLLDDDVVSDGQTKAGTLASGFCREEGIEHL